MQYCKSSRSLRVPDTIVEDLPKRPLQRVGQKTFQTHTHTHKIKILSRSTPSTSTCAQSNKLATLATSYNGIGIVIASVVTCSKSKGVPPKPPLLGGARSSRPPCLDIQALAYRYRYVKRKDTSQTTSRAGPPMLFKKTKLDNKKLN